MMRYVILLILLATAVNAGTCYTMVDNQSLPDNLDIDCGLNLTDADLDGFPDCPDGRKARSIRCNYDDYSVVASFGESEIPDIFWSNLIVLSNSDGSITFNNQQVMLNNLDQRDKFDIYPNRIEVFDNDILKGTFTVGINNISIEDPILLKNGAICSDCRLILNSVASNQTFFYASSPGIYSITEDKEISSSMLQVTYVPELPNELKKDNTLIQDWMEDLDHMLAWWIDLSDIQKLSIILLTFIAGFIIYGWKKDW